MTPRRLESMLTRLHGDVPGPSAHRKALRAELVARFRAALGPGPGADPASPAASGDSRRAPRRPWLKSVTVPVAFAAALLAASQAPAEYPVEVGMRIEISGPSPAPGDWPAATALEPFLEQLGTIRQIEVRGHPVPGGPAWVRIDLWGQLAPGAAERLRAAFPALREARISVTPLEARARAKLGEVLGVKLRLISSDPQAIEAARRELQEQLRAEGHDGKVDLRVFDENGHKKVMLKIEADKSVDLHR